MNTLDALKFVRGAVAKNDMSPVLTHFLIQDGKIQGFNGTVALCCPIDVDLNIAPKADQFNRAMASCTETTALHVAKNKRLVVRSGAFTTNVDCVDANTYPQITPTGEFFELKNDIIPALKRLEPFIADNASRPWACGILLDNESAFATNNVILVQYWMRFKFPFRINLPLAGVRELIRIDRKPQHIQINENRIVFHYDTDTWLSCQLLTTAWPQVEDAIQNRMTTTANGTATNKEFFEAIAKIAPYCGDQGRVIFGAHGMATGLDFENETVLAWPQLPNGIYSVANLLKLEGIANYVYFDQWPQPVSFVGEDCRGIMLGYRA